MKILIVEDVTINLKFLERLLEVYGEVQTALDGEESLRKFLSALKSDNPFDLICLDINLPGMNGHEVLRQIRERETNSSKKVKILMTTSSADRQDVIEAIKHGCDGYLLKPYSKEKIKEELVKLKLIDPK